MSINKVIPGDTIAFVDYKIGKCYAFNCEYYNANNQVISRQLARYEQTRDNITSPLRRVRATRIGGVFYKVDKVADHHTDLWFDVRSAQRDSAVVEYITDTLGLSVISYPALAEACYLLGVYKVYPDRYLPSTTFTDSDGIITEFPINEGQTDEYFKDIYLNYTIDSFDEEFFKNDGNGSGASMVEVNAGIAVDWRLRLKDIMSLNRSSILLSINSIFIGSGGTYKLRKPSNDPALLYIEGIRNMLSVENLFKDESLADDDPDQDLSSYYMIDTDLISFQGIIFSEPVLGQSLIPIVSLKATVDTDDDGIPDTEVDAISVFDLSFPGEVGEAYFLFYKNVWVPSDKVVLHGANRLRVSIGKPTHLTDLGMSEDANDFWLVKCSAVDGNDVFVDRQYGVPNYRGMSNYVRFDRQITNSIITYNGLKAKYVIVDPYTIMYPKSRLSITRDIDENGNYDIGVENDAQIVAHSIIKKLQ